MNEIITILTSRLGNQIAKAFVGPEYVPQHFSIGRSFNVHEEPVSDLCSLSRILQKLENEPTNTIIRGALVDGKRGPIPRTKETFAATPRQWCMIDIDSLAWDGDSRDQQAMLSYAAQQLPVEFQNIDFWYQFSSSMGIKSGIRVHLWFWLDRPCSDVEMKAWLSGCPVDMRMFNPIQIHLASSPNFMNGAVEPRILRAPQSHSTTKRKDQTKDTRSATLASQTAHRIM